MVVKLGDQALIYIDPLAGTFDLALFIGSVDNVRDLFITLSLNSSPFIRHP